MSVEALVMAHKILLALGVLRDAERRDSNMLIAGYPWANPNTTVDCAWDIQTIECSTVRSFATARYGTSVNRSKQRQFWARPTSMHDTYCFTVTKYSGCWSFTQLLIVHSNANNAYLDLGRQGPEDRVLYSFLLGDQHGEYCMYITAPTNLSHSVTVVQPRPDSLYTIPPLGRVRYVRFPNQVSLCKYILYDLLHVSSGSYEIQTVLSFFYWTISYHLIYIVYSMFLLDWFPTIIWFLQIFGWIFYDL